MPFNYRKVKNMNEDELKKYLLLSSEQMQAILDIKYDLSKDYCKYYDDIPELEIPKIKEIGIKEFEEMFGKIPKKRQTKADTNVNQLSSGRFNLRE